MSSIILEGKRLKKTYSLGKLQVPVLLDASIQVNEGQWVSILGSSGSGKSTALHLLGGLDRPDATEGGEVLFKGESIWEQSNKLINKYRNKEIGFVFQFYHHTNCLLHSIYLADKNQSTCVVNRTIIASVIRFIARTDIIDR